MKINILSAAAVVAAALAFVSCDNKGKYVIEGSISNAKDSVLFLENVGLDGVVTVDSVKLAEDGTFSFRKKATPAPEFYRLRIYDQIINLSIDSTETVSIKAAYPSMSYKYEVKGSENCSKIQELALHQMNLQAQINNIVRNPNISVSAEGDSILQVLDRYKNFVKTNYIFKEPNKSYAYFALFQTVVVGNSYNLIFNPRISEDDVKVFAAVATSWDTFHPGAERGENLHNIAIEGMKNVRILKARSEQTVDADKVDTSGIVDVALKDNKGVVRRLSDLKGHVVILDFCSFAEEGVTKRIMMMREVYNKYHAQGLEIYQVSLDENEHFWKTQTAALPWISVNDPDGASSVYVTKYNLLALPTFYLINKDCTPYKRDVQIKDLDAEIKALL
jgi:peroxiredoxin